MHQLTIVTVPPTINEMLKRLSSLPVLMQNHSGGVMLQSLCVCVCVCLLRLFVCMCVLIILYVNCFGRTMFYVCIEYHI